MKGLSIEEKQRNFYNDEQARVGMTPIELEKIFPELAKSEDEKIRKYIISSLNTLSYTEGSQADKERNDAIAWLEKQGDKVEPQSHEGDSIYQVVSANDGSHYEWNDDKKELKKIVDEVEPKFKVGDWVVTDKNNVVQIKAVNNGYYTIDNGMDFNTSYVDRCWHLWAIQDAKPGDVLAVTMYPEGTWIGIFKEQNGCTFSSYCFVNTEGIFKRGTYNHGNGKAIHPATKEQRDKLEKAMVEAGWKFDFEKKELKKIEPSPAWSEEDERWREAIIDVLINNTHSGGDGVNVYSEEISWLKSIKERHTWKPSDEQIKVCKEVYADILSAKGFDLGAVNSELNRLEERLKKSKQI